MLIEDSRALLLGKQKIKNNRKARKYSSDINKIYMEIKDKKSNKFLRILTL